MIDDDDDDLFNPFYLSQRAADSGLPHNADKAQTAGWYFWMPNNVLVGPFDTEAIATEVAAGADGRAV